MTAYGPSRHFAAKQRFGRFRREADINWQTKPAGSVANDPERTLNRASDADCLRHGFRVDLVDLLESVSSVVRIF
jgi:hypothetical protein